MKILVCVKVVAGELNPFDAAALEAALRIEGGEVTVLSMCPPSAADRLQALTRLGVKEVCLLQDKAFAGSDTLATSYILSLAAKRYGYDLIFCGRQTIDGDTAQVGPCLGTMLGLPVITNVLKIESLSASEICCDTRSGKETATLPALLTLERIHVLRFPSLFSRLGELTVLDCAALGADPQKCGLAGSPTKVLQIFEAPTGARKCKFITPKELLPLVDALRQKPRVLTEAPTSEKKLGYIVAVGAAVLEQANRLAGRVLLTEEREPKALADLLQREQPDAVLFPADLHGRRLAPMVAARLQTGLCADCTALSTDGERLFMFRPARSGSILAKIECTTRPQMATVRVAGESLDVVVAGGRGTAECGAALAALARRLDADKGASRVLVDMNLAPYEEQVGLTGKNVNAKVYIAVGISGAVQHTCAIEGCDTVIAINSDPTARIFEHADYGIVGTLEDVIKAL